MKSMLDRFLDDITKGLYAAPTTGSYTPTLVIGLGGTGLKVLRYLKKALHRHSAQAIRLLGIDSDEGENRMFPHIPELGPDELVLLDPEAAIRALARAEKGMADARHIKDFLPENHPELPAAYMAIRGKVNLRKGAGQVRRAGKLLFDSNVSDGVNLDNQLRKIRAELTGLAPVLAKRLENIEIQRGTRVYVVCSLAGGTGAGCLIDLLGLLRKHFDGMTDAVTAVCLLPGPALDCELTDPRDEKRNTRGNAVAALRELRAFMLGSMSSYTFSFDAYTTFQLGRRNLVNCAYIVGDTQWAGRQVPSWFDLCQATAYFLYGILGTGVGSSQQSGAVNHDIGDDARMRAIPGIFNALGVGVVEYPVDEIGQYAYCQTLDKFLGELLDTRFNKGDADALASETLASLQMGSLEDLQSIYATVTGDVPEARYLKSEEASKQALRKEDVPFIGTAEAKISEIDGQLAAYDEAFSRETQHYLTALREKLDVRARTLVTGNTETAFHVLNKVVARIKGLRGEFKDACVARKQDTEQALAAIDELKEEIHRKDILWSDYKARKRLIATVNKYLALRVDARLEEHVAGVLMHAEQVVRELAEKVASLRDHLGSLRSKAAARLELLRQRESTPGFVIHALPMSAVPAWVDALKITARKDFTVAELDPYTLVRQALADVDTVIQAGFTSLNLMLDAKRSNAQGKDLKTKLLAMEDSSVPLIKLQESSSAQSDMQPQKFIVSDQAGELAKWFEPPPNGKLTAVDLRNPHFAMCVRTLHEFGAEEWAEYDAAVACYKSKPWYYHALPDSAALPPLEGLGDDRRS